MMNPLLGIGRIFGQETKKWCIKFSRNPKVIFLVLVKCSKFSVKALCHTLIKYDFNA